VVTAPAALLDRVRAAEVDLRESGRSAELSYVEGAELAVDVTLADS
jgi:hypothetical protein